MIKRLYKKNKKLFISGFIGLLIILIIAGNIFRDDSEEQFLLGKMNLDLLEEDNHSKSKCKRKNTT